MRLHIATTAVGHCNHLIDLENTVHVQHKVTICGQYATYVDYEDHVTDLRRKLCKSCKTTAKGMK